MITVRGKPVADLVPHKSDEPRWMPREELIPLLEKYSADPGLRDDLERIAGDTTDDLRPLW